MPEISGSCSIRRSETWRKDRRDRPPGSIRRGRGRARHDRQIVKHLARTINRRAYTLVELMVVLVIIGILLAMAAGGLMLARRAAMQASQSNNLRQLGLAWMQYNTTSRGRFVPGWVSPNAQRDLRMVLAYPDMT
ncbi:MAG TPA: hypothetical protein DEO92_01275, partial [Phycisphaerales bacterium]|nr:hypothetical protein [Phycisphaerales bacterium]